MKNVVLILCDQLRKDTLGCYGNPIAKTPAIDALAARGLRFDRCYVNNPICGPNRMSLFTGMYPRNHGTWTNGLLTEDRGLTALTHLSQRGCQTANIGKIHFTVTDTHRPDILTPEAGAFWENTPACYDWHGPYYGYEYVELTRMHTDEGGHYRKWFYEHGGTDDMLQMTHKTADKLDGETSVPEELHVSTFLGERACEFLEHGRDQTRPFFLSVSYPDPHHAFDPPASAAARYASDDIVEPVSPCGEDLDGRPAHYKQHFRGGWTRQGKKDQDACPNGLPSEWKNSRIAHTYAMVDLIDRSVGRILESLRKTGLDQDTIVIFTSDHGELLGDHGLWKKGPFYYEGLMNIPLIMAGPGVNPGVTQELASTIDILPTALELMGAEKLPYADGLNLITGGAPNGLRKRCLIEYRVGYFPRCDQASFALVEKDWKYVRHQSGEEELTDLKNDPGEHVNLTDDAHAPQRRRMAMALLDDIIAGGAKFPAQPVHA